MFVATRRGGKGKKNGVGVSFPALSLEHDSDVREMRKRGALG